MTGEFGAKNTARLFRSIEILGILQARKWCVAISYSYPDAWGMFLINVFICNRELASLNEFRKFFGLREHKKFTDINAHPDIARKLENLYRHPDQVELYPGLVCEGDRRCLDPGTNGPNGGTALWSAVFSDAVTLVRSDRFYTTVSNFNRTSYDCCIANEGFRIGTLVLSLAGEWAKSAPYRKL